MNNTQDFFRIFHPLTATGVYTHWYRTEGDGWNGYNEYNGYREEYEQMINYHNESLRHPSIDVDTFVKRGRGCTDAQIYGFAHTEDLKRWFSYGELETLHKIGFYLLKAKVDHYMLYEHQIVASFEHKWYDDEVVSLRELL